VAVIFRFLRFIASPKRPLAAGVRGGAVAELRMEVGVGVAARAWRVRTATRGRRLWGGRGLGREGWLGGAVGLARFSPPKFLEAMRVTST